MLKHMTTVYGTIIVAAIIAFVIYALGAFNDFMGEMECMTGISDSATCSTSPFNQ